jgi:hypothetical protein
VACVLHSFFSYTRLCLIDLLTIYNRQKVHTIVSASSFWAKRLLAEKTRQDVFGGENEARYRGWWVGR